MIGKYEEQVRQSATTRPALDPDAVIAHFGLDYLTGAAVSLLLQGGSTAANLRLAMAKLQKRIELAETVHIERRSATVMADVPRP